MYRLSIPCAGNSTTQLAGGLGCVQCGGTCGQGQGLGLFDSGLDLTGWGWPEYAVAAVSVWGILGIFGSSRRAYSGVSKAVRKRKSRSSKRERLQRELSEL
jgi:hypothetical protein